MSEHLHLLLPTAAIAGSKDSIVPPLLIQPWQVETSSPFSFNCIRDDHFYYMDATARQLLVTKIRPLSVLDNRCLGQAADSMKSLGEV